MENILSHSVGWLFTLWLVLVWCNPICQFLLLFSVILGSYPENHCLYQNLDVFPGSFRFHIYIVEQAWVGYHIGWEIKVKFRLSACEYTVFLELFAEVLSFFWCRFLAHFLGVSWLSMHGFVSGIFTVFPWPLHLFLWEFYAVLFTLVLWFIFTSGIVVAPQWWFAQSCVGYLGLSEF